MTDKDTYYIVSVDIDTDNDFALDIDYELSAKADTLQEACDKMVQVLKDAKVTWSSKGSVTNGDVVTQRWDKADSWYDIRDRFLRRLRRGLVPFGCGGNQTIRGSAVERSRSEDAEISAAKAKLTERELQLLQNSPGKSVGKGVDSWYGGYGY